MMTLLQKFLLISAPLTRWFIRIYGISQPWLFILPFVVASSLVLSLLRRFERVTLLLLRLSCSRNLFLLLLRGLPRSWVPNVWVLRRWLYLPCAVRSRRVTPQTAKEKLIWALLAVVVVNTTIVLNGILVVTAKARLLTARRRILVGPWAIRWSVVVGEGWLTER